MTAPNLVNIQTITAKTTAAALTTTLTTDILANAASSGKVFKVNTILVSNVDGSNAADVTVEYYDGTQWIEIIGLRSADKGFFVAGGFAFITLSFAVISAKTATEKS